VWLTPAPGAGTVLDFLLGYVSQRITDRQKEAIMEPRTFGAYTATEYIGVPGRTEAYKGTGPDGAWVAILAAPVDSDATAERYAERAQTAAALTHPDVARVKDWGREGDTFWVAEEWVDGRSLDLVLKEYQTIRTQAAASYGMQVAAALSDAHARGLVHGDIRPESIILMGEDDVKLAGLGAPNTADAMVLPQDAPPAAAHYLSPEQSQGAEAQPKSDLYALGCVLYQLTTGSVPFDAQTGIEVAALQATRAPEPPRRVNPDISASLENVIMKAMVK
jgi:serine/threonine-protein kinase